MSTDNNLWMGDIQSWMDESFILRSFNYYNINPLSVKLIHDRNTNELKNFCFINFESIEEANKCLIMLNGKQIPNTPHNIPIKFKLNWANYFSSFNKSVYVGNLSPDVDDISLFNLFKEKYSSVHHASVITDKGKSKGYGFILFRGEKDYKRCLNEMQGIRFHGNIIKVNEQKKKDDDIKINNYNFNSVENNENNIYNFNNSINISHHRPNKKNNNNNNNEQNSLNNIYNLNKLNKIKFDNLNINAQLSNNINNTNNYNTDTNLYINQNNNNNQNIINNIININNINKVNNINYINDINNINNKTHVVNNNNLTLNKNINISINNNINRNMLDISNHPSLYSNDNYYNNNENKSTIINNINPIINNTNNINNTNKNKKNSKKENNTEYKLEIFNKYDYSTLKKKINENLGKMYNYYMEIYPYDISKLKCKLYYINYYLIF